MKVKFFESQSLFELENLINTFIENKHPGISTRKLRDVKLVMDNITELNFKIAIVTYTD